jgi:hypothetical protein
MSGEFKPPLPRIRRQIGELGSRRDPKETGLRVYIPLPVYQKMSALTMSAESETSAMGFVHLEKDSDITTLGQEVWVDELVFVKNKSSAASTELDQDDLAQVMMAKMKEGRDLMHMRLWFHTHYNFDVFWSPTDRNASKNTLENSRWTLSIVMNQRHELRACVDVYRPEHHWYDEVPIYLVLDCPTQKWDRWAKQAHKRINSERMIALEDWRSAGGDEQGQELSPEFIERIRKEGGIVTREDAGKNKAEVVEGDPDDHNVIHHVCSCNKVLEVPASCKKFKCPECEQHWDLNYKTQDGKGSKGQADDPEQQLTADRLYVDALQMQTHLNEETDPKALNGFPCKELFMPAVDEEFVGGACFPYVEDVIDNVEYITADRFVELELVFLGTHGHMRVYANGTQYYCTDDHPTLSTVFSASFASSVETDQWPNRFIPVRDDNATVVAFGERATSIWYDLWLKTYVSTYHDHSKAEDPTGDIEYFDDMSERRVKNVISAMLIERQEGGSRANQPYQPNLPSPPAPRRLVQSGAGKARVGQPYGQGALRWEEWCAQRQDNPVKVRRRDGDGSLKNVRLRLDATNLDPA